MVSRPLVTALILLLGTGIAAAQLQLSPKPSEYELDGVKFHQLAFPSDGRKDATYSPPTGWSYSGSSTRLTLRPPNQSLAEAVISILPTAEPATFDEPSRKKLDDEALAGVPLERTSLEIVARAMNPLQIEGKETYLVTLDYILHGEKFARTILFLNRPKDQMRFQLTCRQADFNDLQKAFQGSLYSWQGI